MDEEIFDEYSEFTKQEYDELCAEYEVESDRERVDSHGSSKSSY